MNNPGYFGLRIANCELNRRFTPGLTAVNPKSFRAFTLIELLTVIVVIGLLVALALPSLNRVRIQTKRSASMSRLNLISGGCEMYKTDFGDFPDSAPADGLQGRQRLVKFLVGYGNDDGKDGFGFRIQTRGVVYGPYNGTEELQIVGSPAAFVDAFGNEIYYYRFNGSSYTGSDNSGGPSDINSYASDSNGYLIKSFILATPGPDKEWMAYRTDRETDDITNFIPED